MSYTFLSWVFCLESVSITEIKQSARCQAFVLFKKRSGFCSIQTFNWLDKARPAMSATGSWWRSKSQRYGHVRTSWNPGSFLRMFIGSDNLRFFPHCGPSCCVGDILSMSITPQAHCVHGGDEAFGTRPKNLAQDLDGYRILCLQVVLKRNWSVRTVP